jgi:putative transposase
MPRIKRLVVPKLPVHVTQRGNRREDIFQDDGDKEYYITLFQLLRKKHKVKLYSWCLMDNHVHFILEPQNQKGLSNLFRDHNTAYVRYYHSKYKTEGRLLGDRFFSSVLDEEYFYEAIRYVELNPYRAKMEIKPAVYAWTSAHERLGRRNLFFLHRLPEYFQVDNWWEYLTDVVDLSEIWELIRTSTKKSKPLGKHDFMKTKNSLVCN